MPSNQPAAESDRVREVALLVETDSSWGRSVTRGVADYARRFGPWNLLIENWGYSQRWSLPDRWQGDGMIARISTPLQLARLRQRKLPVVNVDDLFENLTDVGAVLTNEAERAGLALDHLRGKGFRHFGYFAPPSQEYSKRCGQEFVAAVKQAGFECQVYKPGYRSGRHINRGEEQHRVKRWLDHSPRPLAVLAVDAPRGRQLAEICRLEGIRVPDEVAILAGNGDELLCDVCTPPLSSITVASQRIGYEAAALLDRLMEGKSAPKRPIRVSPLGVISRQSTDMLAIDDQLIVRALRFIQTHAFRGIVVDDVLADVPVSRRYLEREFNRYFGRPPAEEIRRIRLDRGKELVTHSDLSIEEVATACGYSGATQFGVAFRKRFGQTPLAYRRHVMKR